MFRGTKWNTTMFSFFEADTDKDDADVSLAPTSHRGADTDLRTRLAHSACGGVGLRAILAPYPRRVGQPSGDGVLHAEADFFSYERGLTTPTAAVQIPRNPATQAGSSHYGAPQATFGSVGTRLIS